MLKNALFVEVLDLQGHIPQGHRLLGIDVFNFAAHHAGDDGVHVQVLRPIGGHHTAVHQDGDVVGDLEDLLHLVGDVDDGHALFLQLGDLLEEQADLRSVMEEVGSSMMMIWALLVMALVISSIWMSETVRVFSFWSGA